jgi:hypothetical protein
MQKTFSRRRKIAYSLFLGILMFAVIEGLSQWTFQTLYGFHYHPKRLWRLTSESWLYGSDETGVPDYLANLVVHPYFGFGVEAHGQDKAGFGFAQRRSPMESLKYDDRLRVLVLGGSVAVQLMQPDPAFTEQRTLFLEGALRNALDRSGYDTRLWFFVGALPGSKQPQQFLAYSFLMSLGAEFDLIVNIDGFNEMTLALSEAKAKGLHPAYPRGWEIMLGSRLTGGKLRQIAQLLKIREQQASLIESAKTNVFARPTLVGLLLAARVVANERRAQAFVAEVEQTGQEGELTLEEGGVPFDYANEAHTYDYLAKLWQRSSTMLSKLAEANNTAYLHVFQPNQYLEGSKELTELELEKFYYHDGLFGTSYRSSYPYFREQMDVLLAKGEWFADASMIFKEVKDTVYLDSCCHFNTHGLRLLSQFIADQIVSGLDHTSVAPGRVGNREHSADVGTTQAETLGDYPRATDQLAPDSRAPSRSGNPPK